MRKSVFDHLIFCYTRGFFSFDGRARRAEFWSFVMLGSAIAVILSPIKPLAFFFTAISVAPSIAVGARRLHDIGRRGWWQLLLLIPIAGWFTYLVFMCLPGHPDDNAYGPDPKV